MINELACVLGSAEGDPENLANAEGDRARTENNRHLSRRGRHHRTFGITADDGADYCGGYDANGQGPNSGRGTGAKGPRYERSQGTNEERHQRQHGDDPCRGQFVGIDAEFLAGMHGEGLLGPAHHLAGGRLGTIGRHAVAFVDCGKFLGFVFGVVPQLAQLDLKFAANQVVLRGDADPFACGH